jgi:hypothetical protein
LAADADLFNAGPDRFQKPSATRQDPTADPFKRISYMNKTYKYTLTLSALLLLPSSVSAFNLSEYRGFHLNDGLESVAHRMGVDPKDAAVLHFRPVLIQELTWRSEPTDSVDQVVFGFYDGELFRMVVNYERSRTDGLTATDLIEAISDEYGPATIPSAELSLSTVYDDNESVQVLALWEDAHWTFNLVQSKYQSVFFLVALSKERSVLAEEAMTEARRLDREEAPQREMDRQSAEHELKLLEREKSRLENKPSFRP